MTKSVTPLGMMRNGYWQFTRVVICVWLIAMDGYMEAMNQLRDSIQLRGWWTVEPIDRVPKRRFPHVR